MSSGNFSGTVPPACATDTLTGACSFVWIIGTVWVQPPFSPAGSRPAALNCSMRYGIVLSSPGVPGARPWNSSDASTRVMSDMRCMFTCGCGAAAAPATADKPSNPQSTIDFIRPLLRAFAQMDEGRAGRNCFRSILLAKAEQRRVHPLDRLAADRVDAHHVPLERLASHQPRPAAPRSVGLLDPIARRL